MQRRKVYLQIFTNLLLTIALILFIVFCVPKILKFFLPFVIGFVISLIANPVVRFMEKKIKIVRKHGSAIIIVLVLAAIVGVLYLLGSFLVNQVVSLVEDLPMLVQAAEKTFTQLSQELAGLIAKLPVSVKNVLGNLNDSLSKFIGECLENISMPTLSDAGNYVKNIADFLLQFILTILASYFMTADRDKLANTIAKITPESVKATYRLVMDNFKNAVGGYFKAQFKIMLIILLILFLVFEILGVSYSFLLALVVAFIDLLPIFGTGTVIGPWVVVDIINGNIKRAIVLTVLYLVCQLVKQLLQPKMVGDSIGLNPFTALVFMFIGYRVSGIVGMIFGIPIGMVLISFYRLGMFDRLIQGFRIIVSDLNEFRKF
ncbi:MAG: sporulation integral membrane protein YtvI [Lachnospiraceae bacterium]|nr:sporulation integral membrane protein YtvI [Lachnospiraceae bacterium]